MSLSITGIDHLNLDVKNLDQTVEFYSKLFGFTVLKEQPEENIPSGLWIYRVG